MRSLIIPGWGQVYNHHWWKAPPLYAGLGLFVSAIIFNQRNYSDFIALAKIKRTGAVPTPASPLYSLYLKHKDAYDKYSYLSEENMVTASNGFIRNRDLSILGFIGLWGLNVVDAYISAKFIKSYSMDNDLSFRISPELIYQGSYAANNSLLMPSLKITLSLN
jgi:hypothetical protein